MNAKTTLRGRISTLVLRACKLKESQWDAGYGTRTLEVAEIITRLRNALAAYGQQDDDFFVRFYLRQWNDLQRVMPGPQSRCQTMRREMVEMYGYCLERCRRVEGWKSGRESVDVGVGVTV